MSKWKLNQYLFHFRGRYWYKNIKHIPIVIKRIFFCLKHGYMPQARWETFSFMTDMMTEIITNYRNNRTATPWLLKSEYSAETEEDNYIAYNKMCDKMLEELAVMKEFENVDIDDLNELKKQNILQESAAIRFWNTFGENYFSWWD